MKRLPAILTWFSTFASAEEKTTFDEHVFPIFQQSCLNCHNPDKAKGGLDLSSFSGTLKGSSGGKVVAPGDPGSSLLACVEQSAEPKMPPEGEKLATAQIEILKRWIDGGLLENKSSSARKPPKPKFETALRSDPAAKPDGPPPMPEHLLLEPTVVTPRASAIHAIASSPWAPLLAITGQRQVLLHHTETLELIGILPFPEGDPISLSFTTDGRYLIVGGGTPGKSGTTVTFDVTNGSRQLTVAKEFDSVLASDIRPDFDLIATGGPSRLLKVWNTETGSLLHSIKKHTDWITAIDFSPDGVLLASGDRNGGVWVWESQSCNEFHTLRGHQAAITATAFRGDSNILATASEDGTVRFWEMNGGSEVKKIDAHPGGVSAFAFGRDGSSVTVGRDLKAKLWKPDFSHARDLSQKLPYLPTSVALDAESKRAFIADAEGTIQVFETATGKHLAEIQANPPTIESRLITLKKSISAAGKSTTGKDDPQSELTILNRSLKHWAAAAINTRAHTTRHEAEESADATHEHQDHFTLAAEAITHQTLVLTKKRSEYGRLANRPTTELSDQAQAELQATLAAVQIRIGIELEALMTSEKELLTLHESINQSAPIAQQKMEDLQSLIAAYQKALK
jgi:WD40 repeat protein